MKKIRSIAVLVLIVAGLIATFSAFTGRGGGRDVSASIETLHNDRLVAASYLYKLSELVHNKRLLVEKLEQTNSVIIAEENIGLTPRIRELLSKYEGTNLTIEEQQIFGSLVTLTDEIGRIEADHLYSYQVRDRLRYLNAETLAKLNDLVSLQLKEGSAAVAAGQSAVSSGIVSGNLITALVVVGLIGLIFAVARLSSKTNGMGRPYVRYLNSLMI